MEELIILNPDKLGYKDRGIIKWQGMILSEQSEALKETKYEHSKAKEEMTIEKISEVLYLAYANKKLVSIQANVLRNGSYYPDVIARVIGYMNNEIIFKVKKSDEQEVIKKVNFNFVRNVEFYDPLENDR